jgi:hypothetical protein
VGGQPLQPVDQTAEAYNPASNRWTFTTPTVYQHAEHATVALADGRVLVTGGYVVPDSAEIYDPNTNTWHPVASMRADHEAHTATLLRDGRVLVVGGCNDEVGCSVSTAEIYDPNTDQWSLTGSLAAGRSDHRAILLPDGRVLVAGGSNGILPLASTELYDPVTGTWTAGMDMHDARSSFGLAAIQVRQRTLFVAAGGCCVPLTPAALPTSEVYDPVGNRWVQAGDLNIGRKEFAFGSLGDGSVVIAGGESNELFLKTSERFNPRTMTWQLTDGQLPHTGAEMPLVILPNGTAFIAGGIYNDEFNIATPATAVLRP